MAAALGFLIVAAGLAGLYFIAKAEGVDVGAELQNVSDQIKSAAAAVTGGGDDPISIAMPIIQGFESFSERAYPDPPGSGKYSIGWGHQIQPGEPYGPDSVIGQEEGDSLLRVDVARFYTCVTDNVTVDLTANQKAALISFCYNVGCAAFADSTMLRV